MLLFAFAFTYKVELTKAVGAFFRSGADNAQYRTSDSTTTPTFLVSGVASSTLTFNTSDCASITTYVQLFASTTNTQSWLQVERFASDDGINFYNYDTALQDQTKRNIETTLASSTQFLTWKPSILGATTTKAFKIELIPSRKTRLVFGIATSTNSTTGRDRANIWVDNACNIQNY